MEWLSRIAEISKLTTRQYVIAALTSGAVLFSPPTILKRLGLDSIPSPYGTFIGLVFLVSLSFVVVNCASCGVAWYRRKIRVNDHVSHIRCKMLNLDDAECSVLREFILQGQKVIRLLLTDPAVSGLQADGVLQQVGHFGHPSPRGPLFSYRISDTAYSMLDFEVLGFPHNALEAVGSVPGKLTSQGEQWLFENRPAFAEAVERMDRKRLTRW